MANKKKATRPQPPGDTVKAPQEGGMPKTGFDEEGSRGNGSGLAQTGPGPGVSNTRPGIR